MGAKSMALSNETVPGQPTMQFASPDELRFDDHNPRFGGLIEGKTQEEIQQLLIGEPHYASQLVDSLVENGYIEYEPLIVKVSDGYYTVVEGNRRLAAVKEIRKDPTKYSRDKNFLSKVPVLVFPDSSEAESSSRMRIYLGVRHLLGYREWPPLSKARFLDSASQGVEGLDTVLKEVRLTKQAARRFLIPYRLLLKSGVRLGDEDFWMLAEALQRQGVKKFLQLEVDAKTLNILSYHKKNLLLVMDDLYGPRELSKKARIVNKRKVSDTRMLSIYSNVLMSEQATKVLHKGKSLDEASIYVDTVEESVEKLKKASHRIGILLKKVVTTPSSQDAKTLNESYKSFDFAVKAFVKNNA